MIDLKKTKETLFHTKKYLINFLGVLMHTTT